MQKQGLQAVVGTNPRILILGSLPGDESLRRQEYYGNPRNMFWDVMSGVLGEDAPKQYSEKVEYLKRHNIALWDVFHSAEREGSLDANIQNEEFNDIEGFLLAHPSVEIIATNGGKAEKSFKKYLRSHRSLRSMRTLFCKSTSAMSLCSGWNLERLVEQWRGIL